VNLVNDVNLLGIGSVVVDDGRVIRV
jgi:hypothetical protein